ncbi:M56 family metallopeptidase [Intestinibacillus massiliensis]|uniref:M56 family metallopeptidase n=1 Tax=Intestinibacillus massiliensis TaxID=1871029 RepID=UPI0013562EF1|nr:M56 family metallopeptidase [Intestinibacillus massiliensis]
MPVALLGRNTKFLIKYSIHVLFLLAVLSSIRLITPLDNARALIIHSDFILPHLITFLNTPLIGTFTICHLILSVWLTGSLAFLLNYLLQSYQEIKRLNRSEPTIDLQAESLLQKLYPKAKLTVSANIDAPKVSGICKPHIYLPVLNLSDEELSWILNHELQHFRNHDLLIKVFHLVLTVIFWWNPLLHIYRRDLDNLLELRCDASLMSHANQENKFFYLHTILKVMRQINQQDRRPSRCTSALLKCEPKSFIYQRFDVIIEQNICQRALRIFSGIVIAFFILSYFVIIQPAYQAPDTDDYVVFTPQNSYLVPTNNGKYDFYCDGVLVDSLSQEDLKHLPLSTIPIRLLEE